MKRSLAVGGLLTVVACGAGGYAQTAGTAAPAAGGAGAPAQATIFQDWRTGKLYKQEVQAVEQPVTRWERKLVDRTVVVPQTVIENRQVPQTIYVPKTEYVMQQRLKGWWNPFAQPTYVYEYVPVTRWVPQTQMITQQVPTVKSVPRTEKVVVDEPVQTTERVEKLVISEVSPAASGTAASLASSAGAPSSSGWTSANNAALAGLQSATPQYTVGVAPQPSMQTQPLLARIPILSQQRILPWQPGTLIAGTASKMRSIVRGPALPASGQTTYGSSMNVASRPDAAWGRDANQMGMRATVIR
ncbi:MAG: hypothetical protein ACTHK7_16490 [Aureliella sp.]